MIKATPRSGPKKFDKTKLEPTKDDKILIKQYLLNFTMNRTIEATHMTDQAKIIEINKNYEDKFKFIDLDDFILYVYFKINTTINRPTFTDKIANFGTDRKKWSSIYDEYIKLSLQIVESNNISITKHINPSKQLQSV